MCYTMCSPIPYILSYMFYICVPHISHQLRLSSACKNLAGNFFSLFGSMVEAYILIQLNPTITHAKRPTSFIYHFHHKKNRRNEMKGVSNLIHQRRIPVTLGSVKKECNCTRSLHLSVRNALRSVCYLVPSSLVTSNLKLCTSIHIYFHTS